MRKKKNSIFKNRGSVIDKGAVYVVVILTLLLFGSYVMVGGTLPTKLPKVNTHLVFVNKPVPQPSKSSMQLYTFSGATTTPLLPQPPLPTASPNEPILVDCGRQIKGPQETEMLWAYSLDASLASAGQLALKAFYTNRNSLLLGSGTTVSPMKNHPADHIASPLLNVGNAQVKDIDNFPLYPSIFLTDITALPANTSGDAQAGGQPNKPNDVYGTWKAYGAPDPAANGNNLGPGADPWPPANGPGTGSHDSNFTSEIIWKIANLKAFDPSTNSYVAPQPGRRYRAQIALHDGGNPADIGVACMNFLMPGAMLPPTLPSGGI